MEEMGWRKPKKVYLFLIIFYSQMQILLNDPWFQSIKKGRKNTPKATSNAIMLKKIKVKFRG
jgi:hypothetical protein